MKMTTPPENQGQIVEVSYGWQNGRLYQRVHDRSDRSTSWYVADRDEANALDESWHPINGEPDVDTWTPCAEPRDGEDD